MGTDAPDFKMDERKPDLTYRDVQTVLALLDGWGRGRIHFEDGELEVDAWVIEADGVSPTLRRLSVSSPSIGLFRAVRLSTATGERVDAGTVIGHVVAAGRSTPVTTGATGRLVEMLVRDGEFVEYGQPIAVVAR